MVDSKPDGPSAVGLDLSFPACRGLYGLPERACATTALSDTSGSEPYRLFNADVFAYSIGEPKALYGCVPMLLARSQRQPLLACFWNNASDSFIDILTEETTDVDNAAAAEDSYDSNASAGANHPKLALSPTKTAHFISEAGVIDLFVMLGPSVEEVYRQYAVLTGYPPLPPIFALGLHQSRWNYFSEDEVVEVDFGKLVVHYVVLSIYYGETVLRCKNKVYLPEFSIRLCLQSIVVGIARIGLIMG